MIPCLSKTSKIPNRIILVLLVGIFTLFSVKAFAQSKTIKGTVTDGTSGESLPGVTIVVKGTTTGTITDSKGNFTLSVPSPDVTLVFSYIGYAKQTIPLKNRSTINVKMQKDVSQLDEVKVVAVGYGTVKRENLTGSVASISSRALAKVPVTNVSEALAGRLPGVRVQTMDGAPGSDVIIRVRGGGSISQDNAPLYVVDGFPVDNLNDIAPADIQSIDVLKDAATTAIYGSRASNGVILITTKKAKAGKTTVSFDSHIQLNTFPKERKYKVLSPYDFVQMQYETAAMNNTLDQFTKDFGVYDDLELYKNVAPLDKQNDLFGNNTYSKYYNLSVTGGTAVTKMMFSYTGNRDDGLMVGSGLNRDAFVFKLNHKLSEKIKLDLGARVTNRVVNGAGTSGSSQLRVSRIVTAQPTNGLADQMIIDPNAVDQSYYNQFLLDQLNAAEYAKQDYRKRSDMSYVFNGALTYNILDNLTAKSAFTIENRTYENKRYYGPLTGVAQVNGGLPVGLKQDQQSRSYKLTNTLYYNFKNLGEHQLNVLLGQEVSSYSSKEQDVQAGGFRYSMTPDELFANMQLGQTQYTSQGTSEAANSDMLSFFSRLNYTFKDKYLFTATLRRDASSKFAKNNRVGYFPAFSAGWKISSEPFLMGSKAVNELKLRLSYGTTGNDRIPSNATNLLFAPNSPTDTRGPGFNNNQSASYYFMYSPGGVLYNPELKWETTVGKNIGLDFGFFKNRINGSLDVYSNQTKDLLIKAQIAPISGFNYQWKNIGNTSNKGAELGLNFRVVDKKDFSISINANVGVNRFKIDKLDGTQSLATASNWASTDLKENLDYLAEVGSEIGLIVGYVSDGFYTVDDFSSYDAATGQYILKPTDANGNPLVDDTPLLKISQLRPGTIKIKDLNGDGVINADDRRVIGHALPKATGGFGLTGNYKRFDFSAFFNWSYGNDEYNTGKIAFNMLYSSNGGRYQNMLATMDPSKRFTYVDTEGKYGPAGAVITDLATLGKMNAGKTIWSGNMSFAGRTPVLTDWAVEDGSYIRFSNLNIGYTVPVENSLISRLRIYFSANNLYLWTKYSGYDPDANGSRSDGYKALTPGVDYSTYPKSRSFNCGVNVTF